MSPDGSRHPLLTLKSLSEEERFLCVDFVLHLCDSEHSDHRRSFRRMLRKLAEISPTVNGSVLENTAASLEMSPRELRKALRLSAHKIESGLDILFEHLEPIPFRATEDVAITSADPELVRSCTSVLTTMAGTDFLRDPLVLPSALAAALTEPRQFIPTPTAIAAVKQYVEVNESSQSNEISKTEVSRRRLIQQVIESIARVGFSDTNLSKIGRDLDLAPQKINKWFGTKADTFRYAVEQVSNVLIERLRDSIDSSDETTSPEQILAAVVYTIAFWGREQPAFIQAMYQVIVLPDDSRYFELRRILLSRYFQPISGIRKRVISQTGGSGRWFNIAAAYVTTLAFRFAKDWERTLESAGIDPSDPEGGELFVREIAKNTVDFVLDFTHTNHATIERLADMLSDRKARQSALETERKDQLIRPADGKTGKYEVFRVTTRLLALGGPGNTTYERARKALPKKHHKALQRFNNKDEWLQQTIEWVVRKYRRDIRNVWVLWHDASLHDLITALTLEQIRFARRHPDEMLALFRLHYQCDEHGVHELWRGSTELSSLGHDLEEAMHNTMRDFADRLVEVHGESARGVFRFMTMQSFFARLIDSRFKHEILDAVRTEHPDVPNIDEILDLRLALSLTTWLIDEETNDDAD